MQIERQLYQAVRGLAHRSRRSRGNLTCLTQFASIQHSRLTACSMIVSDYYRLHREQVTPPAGTILSVDASIAMSSEQSLVGVSAFWQFREYRSYCANMRAGLADMRLVRLDSRGGCVSLAQTSRVRPDRCPSL